MTLFTDDSNLGTCFTGQGKWFFMQLLSVNKPWCSINRALKSKILIEIDTDLEVDSLVLCVSYGYKRF